MISIFHLYYMLYPLTSCGESFLTSGEPSSAVLWGKVQSCGEPAKTVVKRPVASRPCGEPS